MKTLKALSIALAMGVALIAPAGSARAESEFKGKFTLKSPAHWGQTVLAPGEYELSVESGRFPQMVTVRSQDQQALVLAITADEGPVSDRSALTLTNVNGEDYVRTVEAGDIGLVLTYHLPKGNPERMASAANLQSHIPISASGK